MSTRLHLGREDRAGYKAQPHSGGGATLEKRQVPRRLGPHRQLFARHRQPPGMHWYDWDSKRVISSWSGSVEVSRYATYHVYR